MKQDFIKYEDLTEMECQDILRDFFENGELKTRMRWHIAPSTLRIIRFKNENVENEYRRIHNKRTIFGHREISAPVLDREDRKRRDQVQILKSRGLCSGKVAEILGWKLEEVNKLWI